MCEVSMDASDVSEGDKTTRLSKTVGETNDNNRIKRGTELLARRKVRDF